MCNNYGKNRIIWACMKAIITLEVSETTVSAQIFDFHVPAMFMVINWNIWFFPLFFPGCPEPWCLDVACFLILCSRPKVSKYRLRHACGTGIIWYNDTLLLNAKLILIYIYTNERTFRMGVNWRTYISITKALVTRY